KPGSAPSRGSESVLYYRSKLVNWLTLMKGVFFMSTTMSTPSRTRNALQSYVLIGLGVVFLLGALLLRLNPLAFPAGLFFFGIGLLIAAALNPARLMISGLLYTFIGAAIFIAFKPLIPFDGS